MANINLPLGCDARDYWQVKTRVKQIGELLRAQGKR